MSTKGMLVVMEALNSATTEQGFRKACRLARKLERDEQMVIVDAIHETRLRLEMRGVLIG